MDSRLVLAVVLAVFAWMSVGTSAQTNTTTASMSNNVTAAAGVNNTSNNMTTAAGATNSSNNMTTAAGANNTSNNMTTAAGANNTSNNMTTAAGANNTSNNMTTAAGANNTSNNMTTAAGANNTSNNMTTAAGANNTSNNMTTAAGANNTSNNMTTAAGANNTSNNMTTAAGANDTMNANMTAAPLTFNDTVVPLSTNISRAECGRSQLCAAQPSDCDPSMAGVCFFTSAMQIKDQNFEFQLSGETDGYIALILSPDITLGGNDTTYVCVNNNGTVLFFGAVLNNNALTQTTLNVNSVKGAVSGRRIQCTFAATIPDATARLAASRSFYIAVATGTFNNGTLGAPKARLQTNVVDLANPNANVTDLLDNTTTTATPNTTTSHAITLRHSLSQALLIILGVLGLAML